MSSSASAVSISPSSEEHSICSVSSLTNGVGGPGPISSPFNDVSHLGRIFQECRTRLIVKQKNLEELTGRLQNQYTKAQQEVGRSYQAVMSAIEKGKNDLMKELDDVYNARLVSLTIFTSKIEENLNKIEQILNYMDTTTDTANDMYSCKAFIDNKLQAILNIDLDSSVHSHELEFVTNFHIIQMLMRNNFGSIRSSPNSAADHQQQQANKQIIGRTASGGNGNGGGFCGASGLTNGYHDSSDLSGRFNHLSMSNGSSNGGHHNSHHHQGNQHQQSSPHQSNHHSSSNNNNNSHHQQQQQHNHSNRSLSSSVSESLNLFASNYDKWSGNVVNGHGLGGGNNGSRGGSNSSPDSALFTHWSNAVPDGLDGLASDPMLDLNSSVDALSTTSTPTVMPIKSQVQRQKMIYHCKFGEFGIMEGQFTEPSGVAVNAQNDIIVADTNNHRIQIFDKDGRFKFQFGECGKRDGQLLYPNRVAVVKQSGDIIVTERSPTHQIQVYNQYGQFVRKFGADILQHPRGVTVDNKGNIIIVECKVMRVIIFDLSGNVFHKFGCSKHLEFPNGVVVNDKQEIFISDNRAHCVKVFSYSGIFLRNIGGEGLTNYPIGVCINDNGEILVADNHNNFNITIFTQDGTLVNALESKVKHSQCFDVALMDDNSVVLASKDYRIYIYRYLQLQSLATAVATSGIC